MSSLKAIAEERRMLEELATINQMTIRKLDNERAGSTDIDNVMRLENIIKLERQNVENAKKENAFLERQLKLQEKETQKFATEADTIKSETGWTPGSRRSGAPNANDLQNKVASLQQLVKSLQEELRTEKQVQRKKTQLIEKLTRELEGKKQLEEDIGRINTNLRQKDRELREAQEDIKGHKRVQARTSKLNQQPIGVEDTKATNTIRQLEGDTRFLKSEVTKHTEARRQQERTIKAQQIRIEQIQGRLDAVTAALKDLKLDRHMRDVLRADPHIRDSDPEIPDQVIPEGEMVDVEAFELLQRDLDMMRQQTGMKEVMLQEKDSNIEALEKKVEILSKAKRAESNSLLSERREFNYKISDLQRALDAQQETFRSQAEKLKQENARLRRRNNETSMA